MEQKTGVKLQVAGLPVAAMMRDSSAVAFGEVAAEYSKNHSSSGTDNHEKNPGRNSSREIRKEEDNNSRVHQNRQYGSRHALRHVSTSGACVAADFVAMDSIAYPVRTRSALEYCTSYSEQISFCHNFDICGGRDRPWN
jgi:hypothetical protein